MLRRFISNTPLFVRGIATTVGDLMQTVSERFPGAVVEQVTLKSGESCVGSNVCTNPVRGHACLYLKVDSFADLPATEQAYLRTLDEDYGAQEVKYVLKADTTCVKGPSPSGSGTPVLYVPHKSLEMLIDENVYSSVSPP